MPVPLRVAERLRGDENHLLWIQIAKFLPARAPDQEEKMDLARESGEQTNCRLVFGASMTLAHARELEDQIINAMRQHRILEVDLSGVREIDLCGAHLLGILNTVGGTGIRIVATSPVVERQYTRLLASCRGVPLRGDPRERDMAA